MTKLTPPTAPTQAILALQVLVMPNHLNSHGTLFGGQLLAWMDQAGAVIAAAHAKQPIMLVGCTEIDFAKPAFAADMIQLFGWIERVGRTSVHVRLEARRRYILDQAQGAEVVTTGLFSYAAIDAHRRPAPVPPGR